jgi:intracellular multiplication protein IcmD
MKKYLKFKSIVTAMAGLMTLGLGIVAAHAADYVTLTTVAASVDNTVGQLATVLIDVALISGIGFIMASFFKFHQHKQNPQQVQMSQGISLLLIGCGLTLIPLLIPTASVSVLGTAAKSPAKIGGSSIHNLIGNG